MKLRLHVAPVARVALDTVEEGECAWNLWKRGEEKRWEGMRTRRRKGMGLFGM